MSDNKSDIRVRVRELDEYTEDPDNANKGTRRGRRMIEESLRENGPGRSILAGGDDVLIAGKHALEAAKKSRYSAGD